MTNTQFLRRSQSRKLKSPPNLANPLAQKFKFPLLLLLHIPLGIALYNSSALAVIHPYAVFSLGMYWALRSSEKIERAAFAAAYIVGAEVLWRMAESSIFWEFGKYGAAAIMIVALLRRGYTRMPTLPLVYLILLLPACLLTIGNNSLATAKDMISFGMSGPFLLAVSCWFFSYLKVDSIRLQKLFLAFTIPVLSVAVTTLFYTVTATDIQFNGESNFTTSGGFGPNQVSAILGLGAFFCIACLQLLQLSIGYRIFLAFLTVLFLTQSVLTFSRGGIYNAVGATLVVMFFQLSNRDSGIKRVLPVLGIVLLFLLLVFPYLNDFTGGNLQERFEDREPTKRLEIVESDYQVFMANPIFGVGVGASREYRSKILDFRAASHTEFSRIISEHGTFGLLALTALFLMTIVNLQRHKLSVGKALAGGAVAWSILFMMNAGMRLAAPSFVWGLSFMTILSFPLGIKGIRKIVENNDVRNLNKYFIKQ